MEQTSIVYEVTPSCSDGFKVTIRIEVNLLAYVSAERLKYMADAAEGKVPGPSHEAVVFPRVMLADADVIKLMDTLDTVRIPLRCAPGDIEFDGVWHELSISGIGHGVTITWGDGLPRELAGLEPVVTLLERHARQSLSRNME